MLCYSIRTTFIHLKLIVFLTIHFINQFQVLIIKFFKLFTQQHYRIILVFYCLIFLFVFCFQFLILVNHMKKLPSQPFIFRAHTLINFLIISFCENFTFVYDIRFFFEKIISLTSCFCHFLLIVFKFHL